MTAIVKADDGVVSGSAGLKSSADSSGTLELQATSGIVTAQNNTGAFILPIGTTAQRPSSPVNGMTRMNTTLGYPEWYDSATSSWIPFSSAPSYSVDYLIVAGGGGGGNATADGGIGGGAGSTITTGTYLMASRTVFSITVGAGGAVAAQGSSSSLGSVATLAGAYPGYTGASATNGGYNATYTGGTGSNPASSQQAGGGGAGGGANGGNASASTGGNGGIGASNSYSGTATYYGGGGGGGSQSTAGTGGTGGGGNGDVQNNNVSTAGTANTGGGGGGNGGIKGAQLGIYSKPGGSGIVIIRYLGAQRGTGGTVTSSGGYTIHTFTSSSSYTA